MVRMRGGGRGVKEGIGMWLGGEEERGGHGGQDMDVVMGRSG